MKSVYTTHNHEETMALGEQLGQSLQVPSLILIKGEMGAGKTALVSGIAKGLGITEQITSPTFTIVNEYTGNKCKDNKAINLYHFDLYRVYDIDELENIGFFEYFHNNAVLCIEWAELTDTTNFPDFPQINIEISKSSSNEDSREIIICD